MLACDIPSKVFHNFVNHYCLGFHLYDVLPTLPALFLYHDFLFGEDYCSVVKCFDVGGFPLIDFDALSSFDRAELKIYYACRKRPEYNQGKFHHVEKRHKIERLEAKFRLDI